VSGYLFPQSSSFWTIKLIEGPHPHQGLACFDESGLLFWSATTLPGYIWMYTGVHLDASVYMAYVSSGIPLIWGVKVLHTGNVFYVGWDTCWCASRVNIGSFVINDLHNVGLVQILRDPYCLLIWMIYHHVLLSVNPYYLLMAKKIYNVASNSQDTVLPPSREI